MKFRIEDRKNFLKPTEVGMKFRNNFGSVRIQVYGWNGSVMCMCKKFADNSVQSQ